MALNTWKVKGLIVCASALGFGAAAYSQAHAAYVAQLPMFDWNRARALEAVHDQCLEAHGLNPLSIRLTARPACDVESSKDAAAECAKGGLWGETNDQCRGRLKELFSDSCVAEAFKPCTPALSDYDQLPARLQSRLAFFASSPMITGPLRTLFALLCAVALICFGDAPLRAAWRWLHR